MRAGIKNENKDNPMATLNRGELSIHFEVHGKGPTVLLSHGFSGSTNTWEKIIEPLAKSFQVVIWDIRGHGKSDSPDDMSHYTRDKTIEDMLALLDHVGEKKAHIGGHSLGGYLSIEAYRRHPELFNSLLLFNTGPGFKKVEARDAWNARCLKDAEKFEIRHAEQMSLPEDDRREGSHRSLMGVARAARGILPQDDGLVIASLPDIKVPALVLVGDQDHAFKNAAEYMGIKIPKAKSVVIKDAGHNAMLDQPDAVVDAVFDFLGTI
jgi:pimeloyl-ACP methyl ester carboxylesterase